MSSVFGRDFAVSIIPMFSQKKKVIYILTIINHTNLTGPSAEHWVGSQPMLNSAVNREELLVQSWELKMWC